MIFVFVDVVNPHKKPTHIHTYIDSNKQKTLQIEIIFSIETTYNTYVYGN